MTPTVLTLLTAIATLTPVGTTMLGIGLTLRMRPTYQGRHRAPHARA